METINHVSRPVKRLHLTTIATSLLACVFSLLPLVATSETIDEQNIDAKLQATYIWQQKRAFDARYSGPRSLTPEQERSYSFSATGYFGLRLAPSTELYFNPELVQGVPLSNLTGLGGMTNGEIQKTAGPNPTLYRARFFLRQTWGLTEDREAVESAFNQLAGARAKRRVVLTVGNLAVTDLFDNNAFSHDARTQFLNWALLTYGAYDFAADSRGYSWGAALEYFSGDWAFRAGRFLVPRESNGLQLDHRIFRHYGDQIEIERRYQLFEQRGRARALAFRNVAVMGNFRDALRAAEGTGAPPDVANVRRRQAKVGYGVSVEQNASDDVGVFLRASRSDDASETYAYAEIGRSLSGGVSINGNRWGRERDAVGLALVRNGLSRAHRDYLAPGGLGFFAGDGRLNYRAEQIVEFYYAYSLLKSATLSFDVQRIHNPAYNADRGPVTVIGARVHAEY